MRKLKIYLDTSVISHLDAEDAPEKMADTISFWEDVKKGNYLVMMSDLTFEEINDCYEPKLSKLLEKIEEIDYSLIPETFESLDLVRKYIINDVLSNKCRDDLRHIAMASVMECDYILSWNFKHFVNVNTIKRVQSVNQLNGYDSVDIVSPSMLLIGDE